MATAEEYAAWIVKNADKQGTPEFDTVARAYQSVRGQTSAKPIDAAPEQELGAGMPTARAPAPSWAAVAGSAAANAIPSIAGVAKGMLDIGAGALRSGAQLGVGAIGDVSERVTGTRWTGPERAFTAMDTYTGNPDAGKRASETARAAIDLPAGVLRSVAKSAHETAPKTIMGRLGGALLSIEGDKDAAEKASVIAEEARKHYAGYLDEDTLKERIAKDPAAVAADFSMVSSLLGKGARSAGLPGVAAPLETVAAYTNPVTPIVKTAGVVADVANKGYNVTKGAVNYLARPGATAENRLARMVNEPEASLTAMQNTQNMPTSGYVAPVSQRLAAGNVAEPAIAGAEAALAEGATKPQVMNAQQARIAAIQSNLQNVEQQLAQRTNMLTPAQTAELSTVRNSLLQSLAAENAGLEAAGVQIANQLPNVGQQAPGQTLATEALAGRRAVGREVTSPAYETAYNLAGEEPIAVDAALAAARRIQASPGAVTDSSTVPQSISRLQEFEPPMQPGAFTELAPGQGFSGAPVRPPATMTLRDFGDVRESLVRDLNNARKTPSLDAPTRVRHLEDVLGQLDAALTRSGVSQEAQQAYQGARALYRRAVVEPFKTGETAKILRTGGDNRQALLPDDTIQAFLTNETSAQQFGTTFNGRPAAARVMGEGVGDLFRRKVVDATTGLVNEATAAKFIADNARQLNILEDAGVNVRQQLTQITEAATQNAAARATLTEASRKFDGVNDAKTLVDKALESPKDMDFVRRRLDPGARDALSAEVKNRALDVMKANDPKSAIEYLTKNEKQIQMALGGNGRAEHAAMLNTAKMQEQLIKTADALPNTGLYDPVVLRAKFSPTRLADLRTAVDEIRQIKQVEEVAKAGKDSRVAPPPMSWSEFVHSGNPWVWLKTIGGKVGKNWADQRINAEAYKVMYEDPERFTRALARAIERKNVVQRTRNDVTGMTNALISRPAISISNALADQQGRQ